MISINNSIDNNYINSKLFYEPTWTSEEIWGGHGNVFISGTSIIKEKKKVYHQNRCQCCGAPISKDDDECPYCDAVYGEDVFSWIEI